MNQKVVNPCRDYISEHSSEVKRYLKYTKNTLNNWDLSETPIPAQEAYYSIASLCKDILKNFVKEFEAYQEFKYYKDFVSDVQKPINKYLRITDKYLRDNDWTLIRDEEERLVAIQRNNNLSSTVYSLRKVLDKLDIDNKQISLDLPIMGDKKIPLLMKDIAEELFPQIKKYKEAVLNDPLNSDTNSFDKSTPTSFHINIGNPPVYDNTKHYFEQTREVLKYWENEIDKIRYGFHIGDVYIHPWLYWHINFFMTEIDMSTLEGTKHYDPAKSLKVMQPSLRDNEWFISEQLRMAKELNKGVFLFGTRRFGKTVLGSSYLSWTATISSNSENSVVGESKSDLAKLSKCVEVGLTNLPTALQIPRNTDDWSKLVELGLKYKNNKRIRYATILVLNVSENSKSSSEKAAGATPSGFLVDEAGKFDVKSLWMAAEPSFQTPKGWRCVPLLVGTGGDEELSNSAREMLKNPESFNILPMDYHSLEKYVPDPSDITWTKKKFATFVPAQMSYKVGLEKITTNLADYLGVDSEELQNIEIKVTDWKKAKQVLEEVRESKKGDDDALVKEKKYYPLDTPECFLGNVSNPFVCAVEAQMHLERIQEEGDTGQLVDFYTDPRDGKISWRKSEKPLASYPHKGLNISAAVNMFIPPPPDAANIKLFVSGLDHYKHDKTDTDSIGSLSVYMRYGGIGENGMELAATLNERPERDKLFNEKIYLVLKAYGAECLPENADTSFQKYLEAKNEEHMWLVNGELAARKLVNSSATQNNKIGLNPNKANKSYLLKLVLDYCNCWIVVGKDKETGEDIKVRGVVRIKDVNLLKEIINFRYGGNYDRITSFGHALMWDDYLTRVNIFPKKEEPEMNPRWKDETRDILRQRRNFGYKVGNRRPSYSRRRL